MKTRQLFVDWALTALSGTFGVRVYDRFLPLLDLEAAEPMANQFPALVVRLGSREIGGDSLGRICLEGSQSLELEVVGLCHPQRLYSPSVVARADEVARIRAVDTATEAVLTALDALIASAPLSDWQGSGLKLLKPLPLIIEEAEENLSDSATLIKTTVSIQISMQEP